MTRLAGGVAFLFVQVTRSAVGTSYTSFAALFGFDYVADCCAYYYGNNTYYDKINKLHRLLLLNGQGFLCHSFGFVLSLETLLIPYYYVCDGQNGNSHNAPAENGHPKL